MSAAAVFVLAGTVAPAQSAGSDGIRAEGPGIRQSEGPLLAQAAVQTAPTPEELAKQRKEIDAALMKAATLSRDLDRALLRLRKLNTEWNALNAKLAKSKKK